MFAAYRAGWKTGPLLGDRHHVTNMHQRWQTGALKRGGIERRRDVNKSEREAGGRRFCCQLPLTLMGETWSYLKRSDKTFSIGAWQKFIQNLTVDKNKLTQQKRKCQELCQCFICSSFGTEFAECSFFLLQHSPGSTWAWARHRTWTCTFFRRAAHKCQCV